MNKEIKCFIFAIFIFMYISNIMAQTGLTYANNGLHAGDSLMVQKVEYFFAGDSGLDVEWNFSELQTSEPYPVVYYSDSDSVYVSELTPDRISRYFLRSDSLLLVSQEMPLEKVDYITSIPLMAYPFKYADEFESSYSGRGLYCKTHSIVKNGYINTVADGTGTLIIGNDTLNNVIRLHSICTGTISMYNEDDSTEMENEWTKQEIEERYLWFANGYRYPILETSSTSYYNDMESVSCLQKAFFRAPYMQAQTSDKENELIRYTDSISDGQTPRQDVIHYSTSVSGSQITIDYSLSEDARISLLVCNQMAMVYRRDAFSMPAGEGYSRSIDCSGLLPGTYILYINVNGVIYSEKIKL